jgi:hypothetical protein
VTLAGPEQLLDIALEGLGGAPRDERDLRREDEAVGDWSSGCGHGPSEKGCGELYTEAGHFQRLRHAGLPPHRHALRHYQVAPPLPPEPFAAGADHGPVSHDLAASGLAAVGIYGVVAFLVAQGTREMGIRVALGATPRGIGLMVVRHGLLIAAAGIVLGVAGAVVLTRLMQSLVFGIASTDPVTYLFRRRARGGDRARRQLYPCPAGVPVGSHAIAPLRQLVAPGIRDGLDHLADLLL